MARPRGETSKKRQHSYHALMKKDMQICREQFFQACFCHVADVTHEVTLVGCNLISQSFWAQNIEEPEETGAIEY